MQPYFKYLHVVILLTLSLAGLVLAQNGALAIKELRASPNPMDSRILVSWQSGSEIGISYYEVYRSSYGSPSFNLVRGNITPIGDGQNYSIEDKNDLYKTEGTLFYYKVRAVLTDGQNYKESDAVPTYYNSTSSTAKRTWGSIKAMFR